MSRKRRFRELKTADEEKAMLKKSKIDTVLKSSCYKLFAHSGLQSPSTKPKLPPGFSKETYITRYKSSHTCERLARVIGS